MAFCKVGDKKWRLLKKSETSAGDYIDGIYYKEQFYIVDEFGKIYVCDPLTSPQPQLKEFYPQNPHSDINYVEKWYLVECGGELYEILRKTTSTFGFTSEFDHGEEDISDGEEGVHINNGSDDETDDFDHDIKFVDRTRHLIKRTFQFLYSSWRLQSRSGFVQRILMVGQYLWGTISLLRCQNQT